MKEQIDPEGQESESPILDPIIGEDEDAPIDSENIFSPVRINYLNQAAQAFHQQSSYLSEAAKNMAAISASFATPKFVLPSMEIYEAVNRIADMAKAKMEFPNTQASLALSEIASRMTEFVTPRIDFYEYPAFLEISNAAQKFIDATLVKVDPSFFKLATDLGETAKIISAMYAQISWPTTIDLDSTLPPNWSHGIDTEELNSLIYRDGIPVVWVPPAYVLDKLIVEDSRQARIRVLLENANNVLDDCLRVLHEVISDELAGQRDLAICAVNAWKDHPETSQALSVVLADTLIGTWYKSELINDYKTIRASAKVDLDEVPLRNIRLVYSIAAMHVFLEPFYVDSSEARTEALSRHQTIHGAEPRQINAGNSLVALMLVTSLLRTFQEAS
ncbi:MAG: hypothetical protein Q8L08_11365 [Candidatus Nanopelagicaceae bacterium]|nr:hypothetical protein [Candidatus Nanopelagicaceae bacterium]